MPAATPAPPRPPAARRDTLTRIGAVAVLVGCLGISVAAWRTIDQQARHESAADFERRTDALALHIERRMLAYEQMLRAASGLQTAAGPVPRARRTPA